MSTSPTAAPSESLPGKFEEQRPRAVTHEMSAKVWQLATLVVPIVLTTWLTFWVSQKQDNLKQDIDKQSQLFSQQLQLSEELYKRRFDAYEKLYAQLVQINGSLQKQAGAERAEWSRINADQVAQFNELLNVSELHMSHRIEDLSQGAWLAGAQEDGPLLAQSIHDLEEEMKKELDKWMLEEKGEPAAASTPSKPKKAKSQTRKSE